MKSNLLSEEEGVHLAQALYVLCSGGLLTTAYETLLLEKLKHKMLHLHLFLSSGSNFSPFNSFCKI